MAAGILLQIRDLFFFFFYIAVNDNDDNFGKESPVRKVSCTVMISHSYQSRPHDISSSA